MNTSFPPQKYPQNTSPHFWGGFLGSRGPCSLNPKLGAVKEGHPGAPGAVPGHSPPLPDSNAVIQMKQHFLHL